MTDMRRTLLWVVFSMSLVLIWDAWSRHNGQPSLFGPQPVTAPVAAAGPGSAPAGVPASTGSAATPAAAIATAPAASAVVSERVDIQTDLVKATLDSKGGTLVRVELLTQHEQLQKDLWQMVQELVGLAPRHDEQFEKKNVVVLDESAQRLYVAQSGLIPAAGDPRIW